MRVELKELSTSTRKTPYRHQVRDHNRGNQSVRSYQRGRGDPRSREHVVVRSDLPVEEITPMIVEKDLITFPVEALVLEKDQGSEEYDYDTKSLRPTSFKMVIETSEEIQGYNDADWAEVADTLFPTFSRSLEAGYIVDIVDINPKLYTENVYEITVRMKKGL